MENEILDPEIVDTPPSTKPHLRKLFIAAVILMFCSGYISYSVLNRNDVETKYPYVVPTVTIPVKPTLAVEPQPTEQVLPTGTISLKKITVEWKKDLIKVNENCPQYSTCYLVGTIVSSDLRYSGKNLYLEEISEMVTYFKHFIVENNGAQKSILYTQDIAGIDDLPTIINTPNSKYKLKNNNEPVTLFSNTQVERLVFNDTRLGPVYISDNGCFMIKLPDQTALGLSYDIPFSTADIVFSDGIRNTQEYDFIKPSCFRACTLYHTVPEVDLQPETRLKITGRAGGEAIYEIKDPQDKQLLDLYKNQSTAMYYDSSGSGTLEKNKYSYEEYLAFHPYLYWKDMLGRWIEFQNRKTAVMAEMCKPVVYLYPKQKTDLSLKLSINGWLTHTEPSYGSGWKVTASPDGNLINVADGKQYGYLIWEGMGINYPQIEQGWVIRKDNLNEFLTEKLTLLGLNSKEQADFKDYWLGRLTVKPYYKISFLTREQFAGMAEIGFSPVKPDVFIRVMMTAQGLANFEEIPEQILPHKAPLRFGFTAVEWGGALLK